MLMDPFIMTDLDNLVVNKSNPFGKFDPKHADAAHLSGEIHGADWYSRSHDKMVTNPTEFLFPLMGYTDECGTESYNRHPVEPVCLIPTIVRDFLRRKAENWSVVGYIPDLKKGSSAGRSVAKLGTSIRNYHKCMSVILDPETMKELEEGFLAPVRMGDEVRWMLVKCPVALFVGDGKSNDTLCGRYGSRKSGRVSRACNCPFSELDNPNHDCQWMRMVDAEELVQKATDPSLTTEQQKPFKDALQQISTHLVNNSFFPVCFGDNKYGIIGATPGDLMHMVELGIFPYILTELVNSMPPSVKGKSDCLMEYLFRSVKTRSEKDNCLRMNFTKGCTTLTLLKAHEWPGLALSFLVMLLTDEGKEITKKCFAEQDIDLPVTPNAPKYQRKHFTPPILNQKVAPQSGPWGNPENSDNEERDIDHDMDEVEDLAQDAQKGKSKAAKPLPCSRKQFIDLLEEVLAFHAWYKYGKYDNTDSTSRRKLNNTLRQMLQKIKTYVPRTGLGWKIQKFHDLLHLVCDTSEYGNADNFDASHGERGLREWAKGAAATCQKRSKVFGGQIASRIHESAILRKARNVVSVTFIDDNKQVEPTTLQHTLRGNPCYKIVHDGKFAKVIWMSKTDCSYLLHPLIVDWFSKNWLQACGHDCNNGEILCWSEYYHVNPIGNNSNGSTLLHAHPNYHQCGPKYDYATVKYESDNSRTTWDIPSKVLCFFKCNNVPVALVFPCDLQSKQGNPTRRRSKMFSTKLVEKYTLEVKRDVKTGRHLPQLFMIPCTTIQKKELVIEEVQGIRESYATSNNHVWLISDRKQTWPNKFIVSS